MRSSGISSGGRGNDVGLGSIAANGHAMETARTPALGNIAGSVAGSTACR